MATSTLKLPIWQSQRPHSNQEPDAHKDLDVKTTCLSLSRLNFQSSSLWAWLGPNGQWRHFKIIRKIWFPLTTFALSKMTRRKTNKAMLQWSQITTQSITVSFNPHFHKLRLILLSHLFHSAMLRLIWVVTSISALTRNLSFSNKHWIIKGNIKRKFKTLNRV